MKIQFYFGPDKISFKLDEKGMIDQGSIIPYHGIISRGMLNKIVSENENADLWYQSAHILHEEDSSVQNPGLDILRNEMLECKVLSFGQSAIAALKYVEQYLQSKEMDNYSAIEIWNIKEGHTSSVWKISIESDNFKETFVLNVARDVEASKELHDTSNKLHLIKCAFPEINVANVSDITRVAHNLLPFEVTVTRNEWIDNSFEVHCIKNKITGEDELILVERFITDNRNPTKINSVFGRVFSDTETKKINEDINSFLMSAANCLSDKPSVNINEGDVVWNGEKAIVVAIS